MPTGFYGTPAAAPRFPRLWFGSAHEQPPDAPASAGPRAGAPGSRGMRTGSPVSSARPGGHSWEQPASSLCPRPASPPARSLPPRLGWSRGAGAAPGRSPPRRREQLLPGARIRLGARGAAGPGPPRRLPAPRAPGSGRNVTVVPPRPGAPSSAPRAADLSGLSRAPILACPRSGAPSGRRRKSRR